MMPNIPWHYFDTAFLPQTSQINSNIFDHRCKQWGQIDNSETGKSAIKLTDTVRLLEQDEEEECKLKR